MPLSLAFALNDDAQWLVPVLEYYGYDLVARYYFWSPHVFFFFFHFYNHQFIAKYQWKVKMTAFDHVKPCSTMTLPPFSLQEN